VLFTVCGRAGSKGIKNKNIKPFLGYPLPDYTFAVIELYKKNHPENEVEIALNTDSPELFEIANGLNMGIQNVFRKEELAGDRVAKRDVIIDTWIQMEKLTGKKYDAIVDLDITSPLRTLEDIENSINKFFDTGCDVVFSAVPSRRNPYFNMVIPNDKGYTKALQSNFVSRQEAPEMFDMNASIYVYRPAHLEEGRGVLEGYNEMILMYDTGILDLDHETDFALMEIIARYLYGNVDEFKTIYDYMKERI